MASTIKVWVNNQTPPCEDKDLNGFKDENNNLILGSGQTLDVLDRQQTNKAVSRYVAGGDYYLDNGTSNEYELEVSGEHAAPDALFAGLRVRFFLASQQTGPSTVDVVGLGIQNIRRIDGNPESLAFGDMPEAVELWYDGLDFVIVNPPKIFPINWTMVQGIGANLAVSTTSGTALTTLGDTDIVRADAGLNQLQMYRTTGSDILPIGNAFSIDPLDISVALTGLSSDTFVLLGHPDMILLLYVFDFVNEVFTTPGQSFPIQFGGPTTQFSLTSLTPAHIVMIESVNRKLRLLSVNVTTGVFSQVGTGATQLSAFSRLAALTSSTMVAVGGNKLQLFFVDTNFGTFSPIGSGTDFADLGTPAITALNPTDVSIVSSVSSKLRTYRVDIGSGVFTQIGTGFRIDNVEDPSISTLNGTDVIFNDKTSDQLRIYRHGFSLGDRPLIRLITD